MTDVRILRIEGGWRVTCDDCDAQAAAWQYEVAEHWRRHHHCGTTPTGVPYRKEGA